MRLLLLAAFLLGASIAQAQTLSAVVVSSCGTPPITYTAGQSYPLTMDTTGHLCNTASGGSGGAVTVSGYTPATPTVGASASITSLVLKASPTSAAGGVAYFHAENATAAVGYCVLYNATAAPGAGALTAGLVLGFQALPAQPGYCDFDSRALPVAASAGAVVLLTSAVTPYTYTTGTITGSIYGLAQ